jgi:hypothetical protein
MTDRAPPEHLRRTFRFAVEVEIDPAEFLEQSPGASLGAQGALEAEIKSNLESLPGVYNADVKPA